MCPVAKTDLSKFSEPLLARWSFHAWTIAVFSSLLLFTSLSKGGLSGYDDSLYAHEAKQMIATGDWWNVRFDGLQQHMNVAWLSKNRGDNHASNVRGQSAPALGRK